MLSRNGTIVSSLFSVIILRYLYQILSSFFSSSLPYSYQIPGMSCTAGFTGIFHQYSWSQLWCIFICLCSPVCLLGRSTFYTRSLYKSFLVKLMLCSTGSSIRKERPTGNDAAQKLFRIGKKSFCLSSDFREPSVESLKRKHEMKETSITNQKQPQPGQNLEMMCCQIL